MFPHGNNIFEKMVSSYKSQNEKLTGEKSMQRSLWVDFIICFSIILTACSGNDNSSRIQLLGKIELSGSLTDVWGYVDNAGKEYALVGFGGTKQDTTSGIYIVDVSDAKSPITVAIVNTVPGFDVKVWQNYAYTVNGVGYGLGGIIELTDATDPKVVGGFPSGHNIFIDDRGYMYLDTGFLQLRIFNLNPDPMNPTLVWSGGPSDGHDATVIENRLYDFSGFGGTNIYDVTNPESPQLLGGITAPFISFHHSGWPSEDGNFLFICNELAIKGDPDLTVWDIRDLDNPKFVTEIDDDQDNIHNLYIIGDFAFVSYYNAGFRVYDVSDPAAINLVGEFDTSPNVDMNTVFQGAFGAYPFAPSGNIYITDITNGLFIFSFKSGQSSTNIVAP